MISLCTVLDWLASRWNFKHHSSSGFSQSGVYMLAVSDIHLAGESASSKNNGNLYLSGNWEFSNSAMWLIDSLNYYQFPCPSKIFFLHLHISLSLTFESVF